MMMTTKMNKNQEEIKRIKEEERKIRENTVKALHAALEVSCTMHRMNKEEALKQVRDSFKTCLKVADLSYNLVTVRAMIEGAVYIRTAQKMGNAMFPADMSYALLLLWEDELIKEKEAKLSSVDFGEKK